MLVKFIDEDLLPKSMTWQEALKVIWLGDYFKISELVCIMMDTFIIPQISSENVIQFINESYSKLKTLGRNNISRKSSNFFTSGRQDPGLTLSTIEREEDVWFNLLDTSLTFMSEGNPIAILKEQKSQRQIPKAILQEIVERTHKKSNGAPDFQMLKFL